MSIPETKKRYYDEPRAVSGRARVLDLKIEGDRASVILDATIFYPEGGGQPCDLGLVGGLPVVDVVEEGAAVVHRLAGLPGFSVGDSVDVAIDAARRRDHCQQHSGQHLLSAVLEREYGIHTVGFHLGAVYCTIDVTCAGMDSALIEAVEKKAEAFIAEGHPYIVHVCPPEDPLSFPIRKGLPSGEALVRIVEIEAYDWVACCGTHVASADELRILKILSAEKYKGNTRVYFVAGDRAVAALKGHFNLLRDTAGILATSMEETPAKVAALAERAAGLEFERNALLRERAGLEVEIAAGSLAAGSMAVTDLASGSDGARARVLRFSYADRGADAAFETVKTAASRGFAAVALSLPDKTVCAAKPADAAAWPAGAKPAGALFSLGVLLKAPLEENKGRGGGGANSFRAVFATPEAAEKFAAAVEAVLAGR